jgi:hypothetical protein
MQHRAVEAGRSQLDDQIRATAVAQAGLTQGLSYAAGNGRRAAILQQIAIRLWEGVQDVFVVWKSGRRDKTLPELGWYGKRPGSRLATQPNGPGNNPHPYAPIRAGHGLARPGGHDCRLLRYSHCGWRWPQPPLHKEPKPVSLSAGVTTPLRLHAVARAQWRTTG